MQTHQTRATGEEPSRGALRYGRHLKAHSSRSEVSDSEEERQKRLKLKRAALSTVNQDELPVVVISSDEEDGSSLSVIAQQGSQSTRPLETVTPAPPVRDEDARSDSESEELPPVTPRRRHGHSRRIVLSSDEESDAASETRTPRAPAGRRPPRILDDDVIDLTLSSPESTKLPVPPSSTKPAVPSKKSGKRTATKTTQGVRPPTKEPDGMLPLFLGDSESEHEDGLELDRGSDREGFAYDPLSADDDAILILDEPRSTQKPIRRQTPSSSGSIAVPGPSTPRRGPSKLRLTVSSDSDSEEEVAMIIKPKPRWPGIPESGPTTASPSVSTLTPQTPRMTKKALHERELERRRTYAQAFFDELNKLIFGGGIPASTELQWNKRLLTTAGRAHWHRTREGVHLTSIQLAEKILDCDERIRNTLSHEMCHLACWIIDEAPTENHGALFKHWANKIMRKRPEIEVTTRHNYDIKCKYEWKCATCAKVYGRHSKSINPDEQACGVCKTGILVPQFETRRAPPRTPKPKADSQNAAVRSRDSPIVMPGAFPSLSPAKKAGAKIHPGQHGDRASIEISGDGDSDVEILAHTFKSVRIDSKGGSV
ncbi:SprT-like family-domain-containing protein [Ganoderma leucocontextum]|nr:SprT-like family-domain-containing protein [Ganoderma leucocontextum]